MRYVVCGLVCAWNTFVDMAKYQKIAMKTPILRQIKATAMVALLRNRDDIFGRFRCNKVDL